MLPKAVHEKGIKLVVVSDIVELYCDPDLRNNRSLDLFKTGLNTLVTIARAERAIVLTTSLDETISGQFLYAVRQRGDVILRFEERDNFTKLTLEKHPTHTGQRLMIKQSAPRVLEEFLEVAGDG
jgi:hypothetical protein